MDGNNSKTCATATLPVRLTKSKVATIDPQYVREHRDRQLYSALECSCRAGAGAPLARCGSTARSERRSRYSCQWCWSTNDAIPRSGWRSLAERGAVSLGVRKARPGADD